MSARIIKQSLLWTILAFIHPFINAQDKAKTKSLLKERGEIYIKFIKPNNIDLQTINESASVDICLKNAKSNEIFAYLNENQFRKFEKLNINYELLTPPSLKAAATMCADLTSVKAWNCYPTYSQYIQLIQSFVTDYPGLCSLVEIGQSIDGRKILAVKISDNVSVKEEEPEFFYTSTMHGDEVTGYVLMIRLIDYLLKSYQSDSRVANLINTTEIWINPNSNPDGTYSAGNTTITGATRGNSNFIDLNRNFPGISTNSTNGPIVLVDHPDGNAWQTENIAMMNFLKAHNFMLAANFHGGEEVVNYPWDAWNSSQKLHADDKWYQEISHEYADTVHANSSNYMISLAGGSNPSGITNGGDWYIISGGRQDYVNYYLHQKETTIEISTSKIPVASSLPTFWNYNYRSFLNYINRVHTGVYGKITDQNGLPLRAKITLNGYDIDSSEIYSDKQTGMYYRMLKDGNYQLKASLDGYVSVEKSFNTSKPNQTLVNIVLQKEPTGWERLLSSKSQNFQYTNPVNEFLTLDFNVDYYASFEFLIYDLTGKQIISQSYKSIKGANQINILVDNLNTGIYLCKILSPGFTENFKFIKVSN